MQLEKPYSSQGKSLEKDSLITGKHPGKRLEGERVADGFAVAMKGSNVLRAKESC